MSMVWIASSGTLDGTTGSVTFSSIPSTFTHLQVRYSARSARTGQPNDKIYARFNSDSGTNYAWHEIYGDGSNPYSQGYAPDNMMFAGFVPAATSGSSMFGSSIIDILDYGNTNKFKTIKAIEGYDTNGAGLLSLRSGLWRSTSAISTILFANYYTGANFVSGSRFDLYGITTSQVTGA